MSGSEMILYGYGIVCLCMLLFNIVYNAAQNSHDGRLEKKTEYFCREIAKENRVPDERELNSLYRRLSNINNLVALERALELSKETGDEQRLLRYRRQIRPVLFRLAEHYGNREDIQAAYFAYFLFRQNARDEEKPESSIQDILLNYMEKESLYCRVNTLQALCAFGRPEVLVEAVEIQDQRAGFFHDKILTENLLSYTGDHERLTELLWESFERFSVGTRLAILNYIRFRTGKYIPQMFGIMNNEDADKELRLAAIRYFGKYFYAPAKEILLAFAADKDPANWEYAAISASGLALYKGKDVAAVLMEALHSSNWYIRSNAAVSLEAQDLDYLELIEVVGGRDRYAREMMMYRLDSRRIAQEEKEHGAETQREKLPISGLKGVAV